MSERNDAEMIRILSGLMFAFADRTFKFVSWLIIITAIKVAEAATKSFELRILSTFLVSIFALALALSSLELTVKGFPKSAYVPTFIRWVAAGAMFAIGMTVFMAISIPWGDGTNLVDKIMAQLLSVRG